MPQTARQAPSKHFLKEWREKLGLTQDEATELMGWSSQSRLSRIENYKIALLWDDLRDLAKAYKRTTTELANIDPTREGAYVSAIDKLPEVSAETRKKVVEYAELVMEKGT